MLEETEKKKEGERKKSATIMFQAGPSLDWGKRGD